MPLRSLTTIPPGGWRLTETLPGGFTKSWASMGLVWELAKQIADFRLGNGLPGATVKEALHDIEESTCARLHNDPEWVVQKKTTGVRAAINRLSNGAAHVADGANILVDWLGDGAVPVSIELAQARAEVCATCPENRKGHKWLQLTSEKVRAIAEQMQAKDSMRLRVYGEERLHACAVCLCPLPLKVHVPLSTILAHTDDATIRAFPKTCWVPNELNL